ncbi:uncharacterized protein Z518_01498 [Rhinocladiella mackenziei CBS 650.93]|uniref:Uncharacterized protein n=1 Tax=Rhinocladiella mackenziei CBS 650.93 TaxID=1442369 RepID=A0A0D2J3X8_9EURO|nr:uncharacterized protein Z518_01498 [Rhinocladiella mackenziei CBS 650.93]KIX10416.1 hypothetical protein Z518_01498 [Rhinocladiella mackenziei CBS 650.93]
MALSLRNLPPCPEDSSLAPRGVHELARLRIRNIRPFKFGDDYEGAINDCAHGDVIRLQDLVQSHPMSNTERVVQDLHGILHSYHQVARKRFVASVCMQAADHLLGNGPKTRLILFSPTFASSLNRKLQMMFRLGPTTM